jgi:hypothetical protein
MIDPDLKKILDEMIRYQKTEISVLTEIKFEMINARKLREAKGKKYSLWTRFKYWLKGKMN